jgi:hypothetical protein
MNKKGRPYGALFNLNYQAEPVFLEHIGTEYKKALMLGIKAFPCRHSGE